MLQTQPDTPDRARQELDPQVALSGPLMATKGYSAPEVERAYVRARELCQQLREPVQLFPALLGLWVVYFVRGQLRTAREFGQQCLLLAEQLQDAALLAEAHYAVGGTLFYLGDITVGREQCERAIALYDSQKRSAHFFAVVDAGVAALCWMAWALSILGYPAQALARSQQAVVLAHKLSRPFSLAGAHFFSAAVHQVRGESQAAQE